MDWRPCVVREAIRDDAVGPLLRYMWTRHLEPQLYLSMGSGAVARGAKCTGATLELNADGVGLTGFRPPAPPLSQGQVSGRLVSPEEELGAAYFVLYLHEGSIYADFDLRPLVRLASRPEDWSCGASFLVRIEAAGDEISGRTIPETGGWSLVFPGYGRSKGIEKVFQFQSLFEEPVVTARTLQSKLHITYPQIRFWETSGYVRPTREGDTTWRRFSLLDLVSYLILREVREVGIGLKKAAAILTEIAEPRTAMGAVLLHLENRSIYLLSDVKERWTILHHEVLGDTLEAWTEETGKPLVLLPLSDLIDHALLAVGLSVERLRAMSKV